MQDEGASTVKLRSLRGLSGPAAQKIEAQFIFSMKKHDLHPAHVPTAMCISLIVTEVVNLESEVLLKLL